MPERIALEHVFDLVRAPGLARKLRERPLPCGILQVLRMAAGDEQCLDEVVAQTGRSAIALRNAAQFYVVQVLLKPNADSYRILGATPAATREELRTHMVWLLKSLHPDLAPGEPTAIFASRVTAAWESLKSIERREAYDARRGRKPLHPMVYGKGASLPVAAGLPLKPRLDPNRSLALVKARARRRKRMAVAAVGIVGGGLAIAAASMWGNGRLQDRASIAMFDLPRPSIDPQSSAEHAGKNGE